MTVNDLADLTSSVAVLGGLIGFAFGLYKYTVAQRWKKSELAASFLEQLVSDPQLALCCQMLDYSSRRFVVPEMFRPISNEETFLHNWEDLIKGMLPEYDQSRFSWQQTLYRDLFDHFFGYLERVNHYISINLIDIRDLRSLSYWLDQIKQPRFVKEPVFMKFIEAYEYGGVVELIDRFERLEK